MVLRTNLDWEDIEKLEAAESKFDDYKDTQGFSDLIKYWSKEYILERLSNCAIEEHYEDEHSAGTNWYIPEHIMEVWAEESLLELKGGENNGNKTD